MKPLLLTVDFNHRDYRDYLRLSSRFSQELSHGGNESGERILVCDDDGNTCEGLLINEGSKWFVNLDWSTWIDAPDSDPHHSSVELLRPVQEETPHDE